MIDVSIIIANYNYSQFLNRSIRSAFIQNYPIEKYEIIVVDDSSTDWSHEIIGSYGHLIKAIYLDNNSGLALARNRGINVAQGKYILFLDADDYLSRDIIYFQAKFLDLNMDWDAAGCDYYLIDEDEEITGRKSCAEIPIACGIMFRKERLVEIGMYDETFRMWEEKDLRMRFSENFSIHQIPLPLYRYRQHDKNMTKDKVYSEKYMEKLKRKHNID